MSKRLEILKKSLAKKEQELQRKFDDHFATVRMANGQPLNDKRNGRATLNKWERQSDSIRAAQQSIERTKQAIEIEEDKIAEVNLTNKFIPAEIQELVQSGVLNQWRKYTHIFFVVGVDKARIVWDEKTKCVGHKFAREIATQEEYAKFAKIYNQLNTALNKPNP